MAPKRRLIGRLIGAYGLGRRDAQADRLRPPGLEDGRERAAYVLGHRDERERMHLERRLPQYKLDLFPAMPREAADADGSEPVSG